MKKSGKNISIINKDCHMEGIFDVKGHLIVAGTLTGRLNAETVITEAGSVIRADITATFMTIAGEFHGEITTRETLTLLKTSDVRACIRCGKLVIQEGCTINGKICPLPPRLQSDHDHQTGLLPNVPEQEQPDESTDSVSPS
ncbi:MAG: polymer-forming cytoskeletal protein [Deltaproteobacteria bacterium]|nr:polymer-forming cytoskeletal protein [Deltaproteobacteria bacterium]